MTEVRRLNLAAVAAGLRPAWLCEAGGGGGLCEAARRLGLHVSPELRVRGEDAPLGVLVSRRATKTPAEVSHGWVGRRLGLPCASDVPWGPEREAFAALCVKRAGERMRAEQRPGGRGGWAVRCVATLTTFWCDEPGAAHAWWGALRAGAGAARFQRETLDPLGLELGFFCAAESKTLQARTRVKLRKKG